MFNIIFVIVVVVVVVRYMIILSFWSDQFIIFLLDWCQCSNHKQVGCVYKINLLGLVFVFVFSNPFCSPQQAQQLIWVFRYFNLYLFFLFSFFLFCWQWLLILCVCGEIIGSKVWCLIVFPKLSYLFLWCLMMMG